MGFKICMSRDGGKTWEEAKQGGDTYMSAYASAKSLSAHCLGELVRIKGDRDDFLVSFLDGEVRTQPDDWSARNSAGWDKGLVR